MTDGYTPGAMNEMKVWLTRAEEAADWLRSKWGIDSIESTFVMGSGWGKAADFLGETVAELPRDSVPFFAASSVTGHAGTLRLVERKGAASKNSYALVQLGRTHLYEGHSPQAVVHGIRTAAKLGAGTVVLTNAAGGLKPDWRIGQPILIKDHINLTATSPLDGADFVDMTDVYTPRLRERCIALDQELDQGVYVQFRGPQYETPAEIEMVRQMGGHLVGMSTVLEAIAAKALGQQILGISLVTNLAAGMSGEPLSHQEVLAAGEAAAERMGKLLSNVEA